MTEAELFARRIAYWIKVNKQALADYEALRDQMTQRLVERGLRV